MIRNTQYAIRISCCVFLLLLAACAPQASSTPFIPPTRANLQPTAAAAIVFSTATPVEIVVPTEPPTPEATATPPPPTPTPPCSDSLRYLEDITFPDGTLVSPGQSVVKQWRVENNGSCDWDSRYRLKLVDGLPLGITGELALYPARTGMQAILTITFSAPQEAGTYRTAWQAINPEGASFGDAVYMEIVVQ